MSMLDKAMDNLNGISKGINDLFETQRSIENNRYLRTMANGNNNRMSDVEQMLLAEQQVKELQNQRRDAKRRYNILHDPKLNKQIQAKRIELLEKTGVAVPIDDIIDVYFNDLNEDGLTQEEEAELAAIQKQFEDEEEAKVDAEIAEEENKRLEPNKTSRRVAQKAESPSATTQSYLTVMKVILAIALSAFLIIIAMLIIVVPGN